MARRGNPQKTKNFKISKKVPPPDATDISFNIDSSTQSCSSVDTSTNNTHTVDGNANGTKHPERTGDSSRLNSGSEASLGNEFVHNYASRELYQLLNHLRVASAQILMSLKNLFMCAWVLSAERVKTQRPLFIAMKSHFLVAYDHLKQKLAPAYPIFLKWSIQICKLLLLLFIFWLDCSLRGINSFLRMGTSSLFSLIWLSFFSAVSMVGIAKFSLVLVLSLLAAFFVSFILGVLIFSLSGILFLWMYGSFWTTMVVVTLGAAAFVLNRERVSLLITTVYALYCAWGYVGWFGVIAAMNLSFFSSDILVLFLKAAVQPSTGEEGYCEDASPSETQAHFPSDRGPGAPSTSGVEAELTSEEEVLRLLGCHDYYQVLGIPRYVDVDTSFLKREYRKKAMLVHPDKNMGNEKAAEAFKALQNAYEVLMDTFKRKAYDDELRKEELLNYFRKIQGKSGKNGIPESNVESRHIACDKCKKFHLWISTQKSKSGARFCQDCNEFHQAKDGDGWVEQASEPLLFGFIQKVNAPCAYVCADSKIYDVTEWFVCQEMRCPANTHKASFQVNTTVIGGKRKKGNKEEGMKSEEVFQRFQNAARSGMFDDTPPPHNDSPSPKSTNRKKKGKRHS